MAQAGDAPGGANGTLAAISIAVLLGILGVFAFFMLKANSASAEEEKKLKEQKQGGAGGQRKRGALDRMQRGATARSAAASGSGGAGAAEDEDEDDDDSAGGNAAREQKKQERRAQQVAAREAQQQQEAAKSQKQSKYGEKQKDKEAERLRLEEEEKKAREDKDKKEKEEFDKWKDMFAVEAEGQEEVSTGASAVEQFIDFVKVRKVVALEDLAAEFRMRTSAAIDRLEQLEKLGRLSGIFDDRGKYIYITAEEMAGVAQWLKTKGRINRADLVAACNRIIRLNPTEENKAMLEAEARSAADALEDDAAAESEQ
ncbi:unnamed protein product [Polarella glacialis]|uniref:DDRGK domain-containing protein 1 n=1 Tax=Polarella glacialis TaxID=89957 RepID=A0A813IUZ5_POLGL|nr:unnamed protein product [Polarella glacialis]